jgi:hypothetical protein
MSEIEYAALAMHGAPVVRTAALQEVKKFKEGRFMSFPERERREARLLEIEFELFRDWRRRKQQERELPEAPTPPTQVGLGAALCGDTVGQLIGRDFSM